MKGKKSRLYKKIIILFIIILIPLLASTFVSIYSYNRYKDYYFDEYMTRVEENTEAKLDAYLQYVTTSYEKEPYFKEDVKVDTDQVLTVTIYRALINTTEVDEDGNDVNVPKLQYIFAVYNIDYAKLIEIEDPTGEKRLLYNDLPSIYISITDNNNPDENKEVLTTGIPNDEVIIEDYESTPDKDELGRELNSRYLKYVEFIPNTDFSNNVTIELFMSDSTDENEASYHSTITTIAKNDFVKEIDDLDVTTFTTGYQSDIVKAGYTSYVIKHKVWWQALIAFGLVGFITFSFYAVWTVEETENRKKESKK